MVVEWVAHLLTVERSSDRICNIVTGSEYGWLPCWLPRGQQVPLSARWGTPAGVTRQTCMCETLPFPHPLGAGGNKPKIIVLSQTALLVEVA